MKNSADLGGCYPPRPSASVDNTSLDLQIIIAKYAAIYEYGLLKTEFQILY